MSVRDAIGAFTGHFSPLQQAAVVVVAGYVAIGFHCSGVYLTRHHGVVAVGGTFIAVVAGIGILKLGDGSLSAVGIQCVIGLDACQIPAAGRLLVQWGGEGVVQQETCAGKVGCTFQQVGLATLIITDGHRVLFSRAYPVGQTIGIDVGQLYIVLRHAGVVGAGVDSRCYLESPNSETVSETHIHRLTESG